MKTIINYISSTILTTIVYYLGGLDMALKTLLILMVLDYITGICKSIVNKKVNNLAKFYSFLFTRAPLSKSAKSFFLLSKP